MYFAEVASKSAQYCFPSKKNPTGILLLNEVALGAQLKLFKANYSAKKACQRAGLDSVKGVGAHGPSERTAQYLPDGVRVCMGPMASDADFTQGDLLYSEHVIYDVARCPAPPTQLPAATASTNLTPLRLSFPSDPVCDFCCW